MAQYKEYGYNNDQFSTSHIYILPILIQQLQNGNAKTILDVGCGNGSLTRELLKKGFDVYGIDASETGITLAKTTHPDRFFLMDVTDAELPLPIRVLQFDTIISVEVIEHLYDPRAFIQFCKSILLKNHGNGSLILTTPYHGYFKNLALAVTGKFDAHLTALWDGGHIKFWSKRTLSTLLEEAGFTIEEFRGAGRIVYLWKSMVIRASIGS